MKRQIFDENAGLAAIGQIDSIVQDLDLDCEFGPDAVDPAAAASNT